MLKLPLTYIQRALNILKIEDYELIDAVNNENNILGLCILKLNFRNEYCYYIHLLDTISFLFVGWFSLQHIEPSYIDSFEGFDFSVRIENKEKDEIYYEYYDWDDFTTCWLLGANTLLQPNSTIHDSYIDYIDEVFECHRIKYHCYSSLFRSGIEGFGLDTWIDNDRLRSSELKAFKFLYDEMVNRIEYLQDEYPVDLIRNI